MAFSASNWIPATSFRGSGLKGHSTGSRFHTDDDIYSTVGNYSNDMSVRMKKTTNKERELRNSMLAYSQRMSEINRERGYRHSRSAPELTSLHVTATHIPTHSTSLPKLNKRPKKRNKTKEYLKDTSKNNDDRGIKEQSDEGRTLPSYREILTSSNSLRKDGISSRELVALSKASASDLADVKRLTYPKLIPDSASFDNNYGQLKNIDTPNNSDIPQPKSTFPPIKTNDPSTDFDIKARIVKKLNAQREKFEQTMGNGQQLNPPRRRRKKKIKVPPSSPLEAIPECLSSDEDVAFLNEHDGLDTTVHVDSNDRKSILNIPSHSHSKSSTPISMKPVLDAIPEVDTTVKYTIQVVDEEDRLSPPSNQVAKKKRRKSNDSKQRSVKFSTDVKYMK